MATDCKPGREDRVVRSRFAGDPLYLELLQEFVAALPEKQRQLQQLLAAGNRPSLQVLAHQFKGAGGSYGFDRLSRLAAELEAACRTDDNEELAACAAALQDELGRIRV